MSLKELLELGFSKEEALQEARDVRSFQLQLAENEIKKHENETKRQLGLGKQIVEGMAVVTDKRKRSTDGDINARKYRRTSCKEVSLDMSKEEARSGNPEQKVPIMSTGLPSGDIKRKTFENSAFKKYYSLDDKEFTNLQLWNAVQGIVDAYAKKNSIKETVKSGFLADLSREVYDKDMPDKHRPFGHQATSYVTRNCVPL
jgi:hypothetical protein